MLVRAVFGLVNGRWIPPKSVYLTLEDGLKMASLQLSVMEKVLKEVGCTQNLQVNEIGRGTRPFVSTGGSLEVPYSCQVTDTPELFVDYELNLSGRRIINVDFRAAANGCSIFYFRLSDEKNLSLCEDIWGRWISNMQKHKLPAMEVERLNPSNPENVETVLYRDSARILRKIKNIFQSLY